MNRPPPQDWTTENRRRLDLKLEALGAALSGAEPPDEPGADLEPPARLDSLAGLFGLGRVDILMVLLALAQELKSDSLHGRRPTIGLSLQLAGEAAWAAICPQSPLRRWRMIELEGSGPQPDRVLRLDERILHHLLGIDYLDPRLDGLVTAATERPDLSAGEAALLDRLSPMWACAPEAGWPVLQLCGPGDEAKRAVAASLCGARGQRLFGLSRSDIPRAAAKRLALARLCDREMALMDGVLLIGGDGSEEEDRSVAAFVDLLLGPAIVAGRDPLPLRRNRRLRADTSPPTIAERRELWRRALGDRVGGLGEGLDQLAEQFTLDDASVRAVADLSAGPAPGAEDGLFGRLWDGARAEARRRLDDFAERVETRAGWDDLVLPSDRLAQLADIAVHVRRAHQVHGRWGWAERGGRGLGVTALFAGASGTGKTMAAEVLSNDLRLDLYRIDLSQVVSKYIGETEKNLRRIFEAAEQSGAVLLFDEADALVGKRSEVKDSHDRYANVEVSYLLQRMEAYRGLAILTTNLTSSLDPAFMRRLRFVVDFPFPDLGMRVEIWRRIFPPGTPVTGDPARMARLPVAGGTIRTIAVNAAFLAAEAGDPVGIGHLAAAARREYAKLDKPITHAEFGGLA
jgi:hypothetical protein